MSSAALGEGGPTLGEEATPELALLVRPWYLTSALMDISTAVSFDQWAQTKCPRKPEGRGRARVVVGVVGGQPCSRPSRWCSEEEQAQYCWIFPKKQRSVCFFL